MDVPVDTSIPAQILSIERTFPPANQQTIDLTKLKHPTKPDVTAVETYEFLPDSDLWANMYDVFRFAERPGERPLDVSVEINGLHVSELTFFWGDSTAIRSPIGLRGPSASGERWRALP